MNDTEFETMARRAAAEVRREAGRIADSRAALVTLLLDPRTTGDPQPDPQLVDLAARSSDPPVDPRRRWLPILVAASTIVTIGGIVLIANRGGDEITPSTRPDQPDGATIPELIDGAPPGTAPDGNTPEPDSGEPPGTTPPGEENPVIAVPDDWGPVLERRLAWSTTVGSGEAQVGWENCSECEGLRPWAPIVTPDGDLYIADVVNQRWIWWDFDIAVTAPFAPGEVVVAAPVVGPDGFIYAVVTEDPASRTELRVLAFDPSTMTSTPKGYLVAETGHDRLEIVNGDLMFGDQTVFEFPSSLGDATIDIDDQVITVALSGLRRRFELPDDWTVNRGDAAPVGDGSVVFRAFAPGKDEPPTTLLVRLWLDGTTATGVVSGQNATSNDAVQLGAVGLVQLERTGDVVEVARYTLPEFAGADPLAGWTVPEFAAPSLEQVPRLLPTVPVPGVVTSVRREYADQLSEQIAYEQMWVRAGSDGLIDGVIQLTTKFDPDPIGNGDGEVDIAGWPEGYFVSTSADIVSLRLHSATRAVIGWAKGLDRSAVGELAASLVVDSDSVGWATPGIPDADNWVLVNEGWNSGAASRTLIQQAPNGTAYIEMWTTTGVPSVIGTPDGLFTDVTLGDIAGRPALMFDLGPDRSGVTWAPQDGVVVVLGSRGPLAQLIETARSVAPVDQATWEAASTVDTSDDDGCNSMFC